MASPVYWCKDMRFADWALARHRARRLLGAAMSFVQQPVIKPRISRCLSPTFFAATHRDGAPVRRQLAN